MIGGIVVTLVLFVIAIALCVAINFVAFKYFWQAVPYWVQEVAYVVCITVIMFVLYHVVGHVWGVYDIMKR